MVESLTVETNDARPTSAVTPSAPLGADYYLPPHSKTESTLAPTAEFVRLFLLAWTMRYLFRGTLGEMTDPRTFDWLKNPMNRFMDWALVNRMVAKIETILNKDVALTNAVKKDMSQFKLKGTGDSGKLYRELRSPIRSWRGNTSEEAPEILKTMEEIVTGATSRNGVLKVGEDAFGRLRNVVRRALYGLSYALTTGVGSAYLTWSYGRLVRNDIHHVFSEAVAYEKDITPDKITFQDIASSNNAIVKSTVSNYRRKSFERFGTDALFFLAAPLKSANIVDIGLGIKGSQAFLDSGTANQPFLKILSAS